MSVYPLEEKVEIQTGESDKLTIKIEIPEKHYIYGNPKGPGIGKPTIVEVESPENITIENAEYQRAQKYVAPGLKKFVWIYEDETTIDIPYVTDEKIKPGIYKLKIFVQALLCSESACTLMEFNTECSIKVTPGDASYIKSSEKDNEIPAGEGKNKKEKIIRKGDASESGSAFSPRYLSSGNISNIIQAILYGLLAGFLLNFMPCVLPVISLKIMDIVKHAGDDRRELVKLGTSFTMGIIISFMILAALAAFLGYNFGALFQINVFLIVMIAVVFALTLSLFEVFTINIPSFSIRATDVFGRRASDRQPQIQVQVKDERKNPYQNAFAKGVLTTLLATPCSGPFLGGTLAWAFTQSPVVIFIIFISIGAGMAFPYIVLTIKPELMKFIPKSGNWMITFERIMAFLLMATVIYLIGILDEKLVVPTLWFLFFIAVAFWQFGRFGSIIMAKTRRRLSSVLLVLIILLGYFLSYSYFNNNGEENRIANGKKFNLVELYENKENDIISIIDFTADWCPNCKLVEKTSLYTSEVFQAMNNNNIELFVADLTRENAPAEDLLKDLGSRSIPFLAVFPSGDSFQSPICLRDIYSTEDVLEAIRMAGGIQAE